MASDSAASDVERLCAALGVCDALVFRRVTSTRWAHLGGLGRGKGWAGIVDVGADEPLLASSAGEVRIADIAPSKRLGDELEVLHAVRAIVTSPTSGVSETLAHVAVAVVAVVAVAAEALSCERTVVRDGLGRIAVNAEWDVAPEDLARVLVLVAAHTTVAPRGFTNLCRQVGEQIADTRERHRAHRGPA